MPSHSDLETKLHTNLVDLMGKNTVKALKMKMLVLLRLAYDLTFAAISIFLNNSVTPDKLGSINGLAGSITAFFG